MNDFNMNDVNLCFEVYRKLHMMNEACLSLVGQFRLLVIRNDDDWKEMMSACYDCILTAQDIHKVASQALKLELPEQSIIDNLEKRFVELEDRLYKLERHIEWVEHSEDMFDDMVLTQYSKELNDDYPYVFATTKDTVDVDIDGIK